MVCSHWSSYEFTFSITDGRQKECFTLLAVRSLYCWFVRKTPIFFLLRNKNWNKIFLRAQHLSKAIENAVYNLKRQNIFNFTLAIPLIPCTWIGSPRSRCPQEKTRKPRGPSGCGCVQWGDMWELNKWSEVKVKKCTLTHLHIYTFIHVSCNCVHDILYTGRRIGPRQITIAFASQFRYDLVILSQN